MKRIFVFIMVSIFMFFACSTEKADNSQGNINLQIVVDVVGNNTLVIPDPEKAEEDIKVVLHDPELSKDNDNLCIADLSFLDFQEKVKVTTFEVGNVTSLQSSYFHIKREFPNDYQNAIKMSQAIEKDVIGNCLILSISTEETESNDSENYIIVLDYENKKSYKVKTSLITTWTHFPKLYLTDITGDGMDDIIVSNVTNGYRSGTACEIFRFDGDGLKNIYSNLESNQRGNNNFSGYLEDNYKAVIECKTLRLKKSISLLEVGYKPNNLEISKTPKNDFDDNMHFCRGYQNKKLQRKKLLIDVYVAALDDKDGIQLYSNPNMKSGMKFMYRIYMGKWNFIGKIYAYMNYNSSKDLIEISSVSIENGNIYSVSNGYVCEIG